MLLKLITPIVLCVCLLTSNDVTAATRHFPRGTHDVFIAKTTTVRPDLLKNITPVIEQSIANGAYPGAVVLVAHHGQIIYRGVFGNRRIVPSVAPMRFNTVFDIASLTKVVATTPSVMQLVEQNKIDLDAPVAKYWPAFANHGKAKITVRELLTHTSGLPADIDINASTAFEKISQLKLANKPGEKFVYSDLNFIVLAHLVEIITHEKFGHYVQTHILNALNMRDSAFLPPAKWRDNIAPTEMVDKKLRWGEVQDPMARAMGGVAGNAGLFSTASDLGRYAQCLLNGGRVPSAQQNQPVHYLLSPLTILKMVTPQTPPSMLSVRGLGWDIDSAYSNRGVLFPIGSFGHSGWTGTSIWIDPATETWIIILTSRTHPTALAHNQVIEDRRAIANIVSASITDIVFKKQKNTSVAELSRVYPAADSKRTV